MSCLGLVPDEVRKRNQIDGCEPSERLYGLSCDFEVKSVDRDCEQNRVLAQNRNMGSKTFWEASRQAALTLLMIPVKYMLEKD